MNGKQWGNTMIARIHDDGEPKIGSMISLVRLSIRLGKSVIWVRSQNVINLRGETWEADFYNGGRRRGYVLVSRAPTPRREQVPQQQASGAA